MTLDPHTIVVRPVEVFYLEMAALNRPLSADTEGVSFKKLISPLSVSAYRHYYARVGLAYHWLDRLLLEEAVLYDQINQTSVDIALICHKGQEIGFTEIVRHSETVEILYFGLEAPFIGRGLGKKALYAVVERAWSIFPEARALILNTCALDHPRALKVYQDCGFELVDTQIEERRVKLH